MKKRKRSDTKIRSRCVSKLYNCEEYTEKFDKIISFLYKIFCKASVGSDFAEFLTLTEFCNGLNTLGFNISKSELIEHLKPVLYGKNYDLEVIQNYGNGNIKTLYRPPLKAKNSFESNLINLEVIKTLFLNINLNLSKANTIY
ncbi:uncharacterized protein TA03490 [Theileria annulata]|uniref:Uncharacterized protein n=1 Tax=Theileria annulata TaxID=5874 RepID=Q4UCJ9_THEAN|nr:uncharacterized protein TA03490 [Theileria annulata]CAI75452.1 hypothetical protein, conserved [Theileria annulata]|eukprot:XP_954928.1 hypothetical protein, conserved [Theileria annulata]